MATLSGFTRPSDPIQAVDIAVAISASIGKTVNCEITSTDILVTGSTISGADVANIQTAITAYQFGYLQYGAPISDIFPMTSGRHDRGVTEAVALAGDLATQRKNYVSGILKDDSFLYVTKASTAGGSGNVTFYITSDGTSSGTAVFSNVYADSVLIVPYGSSGNYQAFNPSVSGDKKSITASISQATNVLGVLTYNSSAANGIDCRLYVMGD